MNGTASAELQGEEGPPKLVRHANPAHAKTVLVDWMIGNSCNHACSYCPSNLHDGTLRWQDARLIRDMFRQLHRHYVLGLGQTVWLQFTGGEPTMHPQIVPLLSAATDQGFKVSLISNGNRTLRFWERVAGHLDAAILTYHSEFVDHAHFVEVAGFLAQSMPVHINVTLPPETFDTVFASAEEIGERIPDASISLKPLRKDFGDTLYPYSPDQLKRLETRITSIDREAETVPRTVMVREFPSGAYDIRRANAMIVAGQNRWKGMICSAGIESLRIHGDGSVTRAVCAADGRIGGLGEQLDLPTSPVKCPRKACACVADILITKRQLAAPVSGP